MAAASQSSAAPAREEGEAEQEAVPPEVSDCMTVPAAEVVPPPGMDSWREDDEAMPVAPEDPREAEAHAGVEQAREPQPTTQDWLPAVAKQRYAASEAELTALAAGHTRVLKRKTSNGESTGIEAPVELSTNDWLKLALASSLKIFGDHLDDRMAGIIEERELRGQLEGIVARVEVVEQSTQEHVDQTNRRLYRHDDAIQAVANEAREAKDMAKREADERITRRL